MRKILEKYFGDDTRIKYYNPADIIADEHYIRYELNGERTILYVGCNEGEIPLFVCNNPERLEEKIKSILN